MTRYLGFAAMLLTYSGMAKAACTLSTSGVPFGIYNPSVSGAKEVAGTVTLSCTPNSWPFISHPYSIALSRGGGASYAGRRMSSGGKVLPYQIFHDAARTQIWGDGTSSTVVESGNTSLPHSGGSQVFQMYGRILAHQVAAPGSYTDTIIATLSY